jgi:hypothetical protein
MTHLQRLGRQLYNEWLQGVYLQLPEELLEMLAADTELLKKVPGE